MDAVQSLTEDVCEVRSDEECRAIVAALDALRKAVAVFNDQGRLTYCNTHFSHIFPSFQNLGSLKDASYEDLLYYKLENGEIAGSQAINDPQGWVAHKLELRRNPTQTPCEERLSDGRWININERPLRNGGTIRIYTNITASKADQFRVLGAIEDGTDALAFWDQSDRLIIRNDTFDALFNTPTKPLRRGWILASLSNSPPNIIFTPAKTSRPTGCRNVCGCIDSPIIGKSGASATAAGFSSTNTAHATAAS